MDDYKEKYEQALKKARDNYNAADSANINVNSFKNTLISLFPELKESEDERIRKALIKGVECCKSYGWTNFGNNVDIDVVLAWLEKQGEEPNPYSGTSFEYDGHTWGMCARDGGVEILMDSELKAFVSLDKSFTYPIHPKLDLEEIKEEKVDNQNCIKSYAQEHIGDAIKPKYKIKDWVVNNRTNKTYRINGVDTNNINYITYSCVPSIYTDEDSPCFREDMIHFWDIAKDAKDGDVLYCESAGIEYIVMSKGINEFGHIDSYFRYNSLAGFGINIPSIFNVRHNDNITPATKEQCDFLFQKMREAGYEWDAENKVLKNIEQNPVYKLESTFNVDDWITDGEAVFHITNYDIDYGYQLETQKGTSFHFSDEKVKNKYHLWTIQDAKNGDVLAYNDGSLTIFRYRLGGLDAGLYMSHVLLTDKIELKQTCTINNVHPATKAQRDTLFAKMKEAGYEWDSDKKQLERIIDEKQIKKNLQDNSFRRMFEQKSDWNEHDEYTLKGIIDEIEANKSSGPVYDIETYDRFLNWLKSIKDRVQPQPKQEWSEEDRISITNCIQLIGKTGDGEVKWLKSLESRILPQPKQEWGKKDEKNYQMLQNIICDSGVSAYLENKLSDWLKSLRPTWKPSDEQMEMLKELVDDNDQRYFYPTLKSLYNDLEKLKENKL